MATTKRPKRNASSPATRNARTASATIQPEQALELGAANSVVLEAGDQELNDAPTLTLPVMHNEPEPEFVPPAAAPAPAEPAAPAAPQMQAPQPEPAQAAAPLPATGATIAVNPPPAAPAAAAPSVALTPAEERAAYMRRRMVALAGLLVILLVVGLLAYRFMAPQTAATPAAPAAPVAQQPAAPAAQQPAAPAPAEQQPAAPAAPAGADVIGNCSAVPGLPVFEGATCTKQDRDDDNGQIKLDNTYIANAPAADVKAFYESAFAASGWTIADTDHDPEDGQWKYTLTQGQRELKVKIEAQEVTQGSVTEFSIAED